MAKFIDMTGLRFGRLTVLSRHAPYDDAGKQASWRCLCDCGNITVCTGTNLRFGVTESCGCLKREKASERMTGRHAAAMAKKRGDTQ